MSSPRLSNRQHKYNDQLWSTYITEAIQSGNAKLYCANKNIPYATYKLKLADYNKVKIKRIGHPVVSVVTIIVYSLAVLRRQLLNSGLNNTLISRKLVIIVIWLIIY